MTSSSHSRPRAKDPIGMRLWYEDIESKLALGHPFLTHATDYIADGIPMILPNRCH